MAGSDASSASLPLHFPRHYVPLPNQCSGDDFVLAVIEGHLSDEEKPRYTGKGCIGLSEKLPSEVIYYPEFSRAGMRFPLPSPFSELCRGLGIHPLMLTANGFRFFAGFHVLCSEHEWRPTLTVFRCFYQLQMNKQGFFLFKRRFPALVDVKGSAVSWRAGLKLVQCKDDSAGWKKKWFCVQNNFVDWVVCQKGYEGKGKFPSDPSPNLEELGSSELATLWEIYEATKTSDWCPLDGDEVSEEQLRKAGLSRRLNRPPVKWVILTLSLVPVSSCRISVCRFVGGSD